LKETTPVTPAILHPPRLQPGDLIGIVAPSNQVETLRPQVELGAGRLEALGFRVRFAPNLWERQGRRAGTPEQQLEDLHHLWGDPEVRAIFAATGGLTAITLADRLDYDLFRRFPRIFAGMSDISLLLNAIHARTGLITFHTSCLAEGAGSDDAAAELPHLLQVLTRAEPAGALPGWAGGVKVLRPGTARGRLVGGNLPCATHLLGTPYWPDTTGAILLLEAVGATSVALMRWLAQLRLAGALKSCAGLLFGHMERCCSDWGDPNEGLAWALDEALGGLELPVFQTEAFGHMVPNITLPIGAVATVAESGIRLEETAVY
jgi:muramoyltetrapeptide carboxypeptidase